MLNSSSSRRLCAAAYDIADAKRRRRVHRILRDHAIGGQKSVAECLLTGAEQARVLRAVAAAIDHDEDSFCLAPVANDAPARIIGVATPLDIGPFLYVPPMP